MGVEHTIWYGFMLEEGRTLWITAHPDVNGDGAWEFSQHRRHRIQLNEYQRNAFSAEMRKRGRNAYFETE